MLYVKELSGLCQVTFTRFSYVFLDTPKIHEFIYKCFSSMKKKVNLLISDWLHFECLLLLSTIWLIYTYTVQYMIWVNVSLLWFYSLPNVVTFVMYRCISRHSIQAYTVFYLLVSMCYKCVNAFTSWSGLNFTKCGGAWCLCCNCTSSLEQQQALASHSSCFCQLSLLPCLPWYRCRWGW